MWTIAFGIVLGLAIWFWVMPLIGHILIQSKFWKVIGYILLFICIWAGLIGLIQGSSNPNVQWAAWLIIVPIIWVVKTWKSTWKKEKASERHADLDDEK